MAAGRQSPPEAKWRHPFRAGRLAAVANPAALSELASWMAASRAAMTKKPADLLPANAPATPRIAAQAAAIAPATIDAITTHTIAAPSVTAPTIAAAHVATTPAVTAAPVHLRCSTILRNLALNGAGIFSERSSLDGQSEQSAECDRNRNHICLHGLEPELNAPSLGTGSIESSLWKSSPFKKAHKVGYTFFSNRSCRRDIAKVRG